ncbi:terminase, partial [Acinetobacter baumannii]
IAVREFTGMRDTPAMAAKLRDEFKAKGHHVSVYPDASGRASKTINASQSDIQILKDHGLQVFARDANPAVRDRVNAVNALICDGN